jgi:glutamine synthetase
MSKKTMQLIESKKAQWVDLRFTDTSGKEQHVSVPADMVNEGFFESGKMFDGSSIAGWKGINESDMILMPDDNSAVMDPFTEQATVNLRCNVLEPASGQPYSRDPRSLAVRAENYMRSTGIADKAFFGPEPEFFVFDDVRWDTRMHSSFYRIGSEEGAWHSRAKDEEGNLGHRPSVKGGYFPVPPVDSMNDLRAAICGSLKEMGLVVETHHHEVATAGQAEIGTRFNTLLNKADEIQILKYCVHNVSNAYGLTATFMPKPLVGDNGSGMHCHQSLEKGGKNIFSGDDYAGLSEQGMYYIGGIIKHAHSINAFTNASTNSYKRLVPGFEAPVLLAYSSRNRSVSIRIPYEPNPKGKRIEVRFPDCTANPYLALSAMLMAGLDGIHNKIHPGDASEKNLYDLAPEEAQNIPRVANSLEQALEALESDCDFLLEGDVFNRDLIDGYIEMKMGEVQRLNMSTHPVEFDMYYSL